LIAAPSIGAVPRTQLPVVPPKMQKLPISFPEKVATRKLHSICKLIIVFVISRQTSTSNLCQQTSLIYLKKRLANVRKKKENHRRRSLFTSSDPINAVCLIEKMKKKKLKTHKETKVLLGNQELK